MELHGLLCSLEVLFAAIPLDYYLHNVHAHAGPGAQANNHWKSILTRKKYLLALVIKREADDSS